MAKGRSVLGLGVLTMALVKCKRCGWETSSLAEACHKCNARLPRHSDNIRIPRLALVLPVLLVVSAAAVAAPAAVTTVGDYRARILAERSERERAEEARRQLELEQERRVMTKRIDSLVRGLPPARMRRVGDAQLLEATALVAKWGSDSAARRWQRAAQKEVDRRRQLALRKAQQVRPSPNVQRPLVPQRTQPLRPSGATARCRDGTYSYSASRRGTCSHHGGVAVWY